MFQRTRHTSRDALQGVRHVRVVAGANEKEVGDEEEVGIRGWKLKRVRCVPLDGWRRAGSSFEGLGWHLVG